MGLGFRLPFQNSFRPRGDRTNRRLCPLKGLLVRSIPLPPKDYTIAVLVVPGAEDYGLWETASDSVVPWFQPVQFPIPGHIHPHRLVAVLD